MKRYFWIFAISLLLYFFWSDVWMDTIVKNANFYFQSSVNEYGYFGLKTIGGKLILLSSKLNLFLPALLKGIILFSGLKLLYHLIDNKS